MQQAQKGDTVKVHYHGKFSDGTTFDSSANREPLQFKVGSGQVIKGFDDAVMQMTPSQKKTVTINAEEGYGLRSDDMIFEINLSEFPEDMDLETGMELEMNDEEGNSHLVYILELKEETVVLDANHPLAGKDLIFEIELVAIN